MTQELHGDGKNEGPVFYPKIFDQWDIFSENFNPFPCLVVVWKVIIPSQLCQPKSSQEVWTSSHGPQVCQGYLAFPWFLADGETRLQTPRQLWSLWSFGDGNHRLTNDGKFARLAMKTCNISQVFSSAQDSTKKNVQRLIAKTSFNAVRSWIWAWWKFFIVIDI